MLEPRPDVAAVLEDVAAFIRRFVALSSEQADVIALWVLHTHCFEVAETTPYLAVTSAEKRSGKTRLLELLELLTREPWLTGRTTAAALARYIDEDQPTLLLDESDAAFKGDREYAETLRGILNTGYRRSGRTTLCAGPGHEIRHLSTFSPKAIAGIGTLPDTVADRSIPVRLVRKRRDEAVERLLQRRVEPVAAALYDRLQYIPAQYLDALRGVEPELPDELDDRSQDVCEPLLVLADFAGTGWPGRARRALVELCGREEKEQESSLSLQLLHDIRSVFEEEGSDRIKTSDLTWALGLMPESPWGNWYGYGKTITPQAMANLLKPHRIRTREIWVDAKKERGYFRSQFEEAWQRYLAPVPGVVDAVDTSHEAGLGLPPPTVPTTLAADGGSGSTVYPGSSTTPTTPTAEPDDRPDDLQPSSDVGTQGEPSA